MPARAGLGGGVFLLPGHIQDQAPRPRQVTGQDLHNLLKLKQRTVDPIFFIVTKKLNLFVGWWILIKDFYLFFIQHVPILRPPDL